MTARNRIDFIFTAAAGTLNLLLADAKALDAIINAAPRYDPPLDLVDAINDTVDKDLDN